MLGLKIDQDAERSCHSMARDVAQQIIPWLRRHSTVSIERATARLMGVEGVGPDGVPLANALVDDLARHDTLGVGIANYLANATLRLGMEPGEVAWGVATGQWSLGGPDGIPWEDLEAVRARASELGHRGLLRIAQARSRREELLTTYPVPKEPLLYVIVATGDIFQDIAQARVAAGEGADVIAVIRSTGQSLLDYVPHGATREGYGGTYATQENFRLMREALDEETVRLGRYVRLVNYCSGLCMPEIAAMGAVERVDIMLNDAMYGILFRDTNAERTLTDQRWSRMVNAQAGIVINTGEDNYLTTVAAHEKGHTVIASQFINYHLARSAGLPDWQIGLGHAFEIDPAIPDSLVLEIAAALLVRRLFPLCPVKYMPPTVHKTGDIFHAHALDSAFNLTSVLTGQSIHLVGMLTEAVHTPLLHDRSISLGAAAYARHAAKGLSEALGVVPGGPIETRAGELLHEAAALLSEIQRKGLFQSIEDGEFAGIRRSRDGGRGREGVFSRGEAYYNPIEESIEHNIVPTGGI